MDNNYTIYHLHSDYSNGTTNVDSVTKPIDYINKAKELGMKAIAFSEHGNVYEWLKKKDLCEKNGIKYIHGAEVYLTETLEEKRKDNYHVGLYARNLKGVKELNRLISNSYNKKDGHFYYRPRISFDELKNTSDNIIVVTACIGGALYKAEEEFKQKFVEFLCENKDRCFLEVQAHNDELQVNYNKYLEKLSDETGLRLIAGTDTHALDEKHAKGRKILQKSKGVFFEDEDNWIITMMDVDQLVNAFWTQCAIREESIYSAIDNTNVLADMIEEFTMDRSFKYPKLFENPKEYIEDRIAQGIVKRNIPSDEYSKYMDRVKYELDTYEYQGAIDYLLLDMTIKDYGRENDIYTGCSRGSVAGSVIAYLIGITDINPIKENLNFERFMNKERVSLADIDSDYPPTKREFIKDFIFDMKGVYCADIITFNTVALKGSIRDVCRALYTGEVPDELMKKYDMECSNYGNPSDETARKVREYKDGVYLEISNYICGNIEENEIGMRKEYPEVFEYVDIVNGTIVSVGTHPCGSVVSPITLDDSMGLCSLSTSERPVTMLSMKMIDSLNFVKLDILGLDNQEIINETCKMIGIDRLTPDNVPMDVEVWKSIAKDTTCIFQWESDSASSYIENLFSDDTISKISEVVPDFKYIDLFSVGNGAIRPAGASYRNELSAGIFRDNGHEALNKFLASTMGYLVYQEQIIAFLNEFCGFTMGEADMVRRAFAKKEGTEEHLPKIKEGFIKTMFEKYGVGELYAEELIVNFLKVIEDASDYLFSLNHAQAYSYIGYICGYLREKYPLEFFTVALNQFQDNMDKTKAIMKCINERGITVAQPTFGKSKATYFCDSDNKVIYKGVKSVKFINEEVADFLYEAGRDWNKELDFIDLINMFKINNRQLEVLIKIGYFRELGTTKKLLKILKLWNETFKKKTYRKTDYSDNQLNIISKFAGKETEKQFSDIDKVGLIRYLSSNIKTEFNISELIKFQLELMGSSTLKDENIDARTCVVVEVNTKYTPTLKLYKIATGEIIEVRTTKRFYSEKPITEFSTIYVATCEKKFKRKKNNITNEWEQTNESYFTITYYKM